MLNKADMERRNQVIRAYFADRDWDKNSEYELKRYLVLNSHDLLPGYPLVIDDEWEVAPNQAQDGKGDLVFTDGVGRFAIVEVKWIDLDRSGKTARTNRTGKRKKVQVQADTYMKAFKRIHPDCLSVEGYYFTSENQQPQRLAHG